MPYFNGTACFSPKVPSWIETVWSMNGGKIISPRVLYPRFGEAVGKVFGVDWLFGLDETDPWVKTWRANSNVVFHASYVLHVVSKRADQTLVPMRNFIVGSADLQTQRPTLSEPRRDDFTVGASPPAKLTNSSVPLDAPKISRRVSPLRSPPREFRLEKSPYARRPNTPPSIGLAKQNTLVDPLVQHDSSKQPKRDSTFSQTPLAAAPVPFYHDCPRIDLVALVREKQKAKKLKKMKLSVPPLQKVQRRRVIPRDSSYERFSHPDTFYSRRNPRPLVDAHARSSLALKERSVSGRPVPRIFKSLSPFESASVFDGIGRHWIDDRRETNHFPFVL